MIVVLGVGLILVAAVAGINLFLSAGMIHRLREVHTAMIDWTDRVNANSLRAGLRQGEPIPDFRATTLDGGGLTREAMIGQSWILGFFAGGCGSCRVDLPRLGDAIRAAQFPRKTLIVIDGEAQQSADLVAMARTLGTTVLEPPEGDLSKAFKILFFPSFFMTDDSGRVVLGSNSLEDLRRPMASPL